MTQGWGVSEWGLSEWGVSGGTDLFLEGAAAISERQVLVALSIPPLATSPIGVGDALNPATWSIERLDTQFFFTILAVEQTSATLYTLYTLEKFGNVLIDHRVATTSLLDTSMVPLTSPKNALFAGCKAAQTKATPAAQGDLASVQLAASSLEGVLQVLPGGDYLLQSGSSLLRKLIYRRLTTTRGAFFHLPEYGSGLKVKEPVNPANLPAMQADVERAISLEPEIERASVRITLSPGILTVVVTAKLRKENAEVTLPIPIPLGVAF